ncbi:MAG: hypothetical protein IJU95_10345 [Treponema sp.]|nr:hypothetical protein [Treponema sp.]
MVFSILMMLLVLFCVSCVLFFIFYLLLPSLTAQKVNTSNPLFSEQEFQPYTPEKGMASGKRAVILCSHAHGMQPNGVGYKGLLDCAFYDSQFETQGECKYGCIGLGSCKKACQRNAISIVNGTAVVNVFCDGCGECISKCPRNLIRLVDSSFSEEVSCNAYTLWGGSYEDSCKEFESSLDLSTDKIYRPGSYAFWSRLYGLFHRG